MKIVAYCYSACGTCKKAIAWCAAHKIPVDVIPIRDTPPSLTDLTAAHKQIGNIKKLINTSSGDYRELKDQIAKMPDGVVLKLLSERGNLVKRPFVKYAKGYLVGFAEDVWEQALKFI